MTNAPQNPNYPQDPQYSPAGNRYGTAGYDPNQNFEMTKPPQINRWFQVTVASFVIYVLSTVIGMVMLFTDSGQAQLRESLQGQDTGGVPMDDLVAMATVSGVVFAGLILLVAVVLYVLVLLGIKKRWGWSRILGIILAIVGILFTAGGFFTGGGLSIIDVVLGLLFIVVNIYWLILAFNRSVAAWMSRRV